MESRLIKENNIHNNTLSLWKNRFFLKLWIGDIISLFTFHIFTLSLPIMIYEMTKSTFAMSAMRAIEFLPSLLLGVVIGTLVDRYNRKKMLISGVAIQIISLGLMFLFLLNENLSIWHLYRLGFLLFSSGYVFGTAYTTILPLLISKEQLTSANAKISFSTTFVNMIGPAIAGFLLLSISFSQGVLITLGGLVILLLFIIRIEIPEGRNRVKGLETSKFIEEILEGWKQLIGTKTLMAATLMVLFGNIAAASSGAVLIFYALDNLNIGSNRLGLVFTGITIGAFIAALFAKKTKDKMNRGSQFFKITYYCN
ncbi:hypothetical protein CVD25_17955 [Bacillus canaveralius]|uniref:Major facilitator superfamily (MFS) profile domain-containing protein n=1 Tax=Bacillus canaveralius TaxID=1403243 RepID=A0A2N5GSR9_9BACI|nr:MFS transporter [Bacillus canaveralius]PLR86815.1 hypothetical protein CU635_00550 [Bacillus canaveralius]PLR92724.1 hypothetical protein CVD25_17955 [Bacillus canaveralius]RSK55653.1 MFS transporter [Bacillus canaveralius]